MLNFIMKKLIKDYDKPESQEVRAAYGKFAGSVGIVCNVLLFLGKVGAGTVTGSIAITADAVNNLSDASSGIISLLGFKLSGKPADEEHPYGHGRYEYLAGLMVAVLIIVIGVELVKTSFRKIMNPQPVAFSLVSVLILSVSVLLKLWMMVFYKKTGDMIHSPTLIAMSADSRNDVITTGAVLMGILAAAFTDLMLDGYIGMAVAVFILVSGYGLIRDTLNPILGKAPDPERVLHIRNRILSYPGVLGTHDLLIHDYGPGRQFASVHVEMAAEGDVIESHDVIDTIEQDFLKEEKLHLVVHYDPIITEDGITGDLRAWLAEEVKVVDPELTVHDLRIVPGTTQTKLVFDCAAPIFLSMTDGEIRAAVSALVVRAYPDYRCVITVDRDFAAMPHD